MVNFSQNRRSGFTLIELLVVIAIIGILASILFPVFARARENARRTSCANNLKQLGTAFTLYKQDYNEYFLPGGQDENTAPKYRMAAYAKEPQIWVCPSEPLPEILKMNSNRYVSFMINNQLQAKNDSEVTRPSEIVVTTDSDGVAELGWTEGNTWDSGNTTDWPHLRPNGNGRQSFKQQFFQRHNGTFNTLYWDGHVKAIVASPNCMTDANFLLNPA
ncbi:DUF1559 domain-containing protein [bacterium]|nr:MAG: DUF1559 domain-containing protein [bacterium]